MHITVPSGGYGPSDADQGHMSISFRFGLQRSRGVVETGERETAAGDSSNIRRENLITLNDRWSCFLHACAWWCVSLTCITTLANNLF
jgi:hypothetical protein